MSHNATASYPDTINNVAELEDWLSTPTPELVEMMARLDGDIAILGVAGKMGLSLARMARRATLQAGISRRIIGVSRFSEQTAADFLQSHDIETIRCNLLAPQDVAKLPIVKNVIFMAGRKFGTVGSEPLTWAINTLAPAHVARHYAQSRIVALSTGCVYPLVTLQQGGCSEQTAPDPVGEYAQSCLGRERIFEHFSRENGTPVCLLRLNYAAELRYGVLHDIARCVAAGQPIHDTAPAANVIWQGDANDQVLRALEYVSCCANKLNITGPETFAVRETAIELARVMGRIAIFKDEPGVCAYLSDSSKATELFGLPRVPLSILIRWVGQWVAGGGVSLNKPTHFDVNTGQY